MPETSIADTNTSPEGDITEDTEEHVIPPRPAPTHPRRFYANLSDL